VGRFSVIAAGLETMLGNDGGGKNRAVGQTLLPNWGAMAGFASWHQRFSSKDSQDQKPDGYRQPTDNSGDACRLKIATLGSLLFG
jgi:hypothetical protein